MPLINRLRQKSIFDQFNRPQGSVGSVGLTNGPSLGPPITIQEPQLDIQRIGMPTPSEPQGNFRQLLDDINAAYTPETQDTERFRGLLDQFPEREEPSFMRKLVAGGAGWDARQRVGTPGQEFTARGDPAKAREAMDAVLYAPFEREKADWKEKAQPFYNAANLERQSNIQERTLVSNAVQAQIQADKLASQEKIAADKNETALIRARAYAMKQGGYSFNFDGPYIMATRPDGTIFNTGWESGKMDEFDKETLRAKSRVEAAEAVAGSQLNRIRMMGQNAFVDTANGSLWTLDLNGKWVQSKPPGTSSGLRQIGDAPPRPQDAPTLNEYTGAEQIRMREIYNRMGSRRDEFFIVSDDGTVRMKDRPSGPNFMQRWTTGGDPDWEFKAAEWDQVKSLVSPGYTPANRGAGTGDIYLPPGNNNPPGSPPPPTNELQPYPPTGRGAPPPASPGWKYVPKPGGGWTAVPDQ